ncbi:MAG: flagellar basal body P-ring formation chaperone FlgA [Cyanobacteria bacterium P01_H01_bin.74]
MLIWQTAAFLILTAFGVVSVAQARVQIAKAHAASVVKSHVLKQLNHFVPNDATAEITVKLLHYPGHALWLNSVDHASAVDLKVQSDLKNRYSSRTIVRLTCSTPSGESREIGIPVEVKIEKPVWVVQTPISAQESIRREQFKLLKKSVALNYPYIAGNPFPFAKYAARVNLLPGQLLDIRKISIPPDVAYNNAVHITLRSAKGFEVTVPGIALADGKIGQQIKVKQTLFQHKYYTGTVVSKNRIIVEI